MASSLLDLEVVQFCLFIGSQVICGLISWWIVTLYGTKKIERPSLDDDDRDQSVRPFKIEIPEEDVQDLIERLKGARYPDQLDEMGWKYGTELSYLQKLVDYWKNTFNWREQERLLNQLPQFKTTISGRDIHFIHQKSDNPKVSFNS